MCVSVCLCLQLKWTRARAMLWKLFVHKQSSFMGNILLLRIECVDRIVTVTAKKKTLNNICQQQQQRFSVTRIDESTTELIYYYYLFTNWPIVIVSVMQF